MRVLRVSKRLTVLVLTVLLLSATMVLAPLWTAPAQSDILPGIPDVTVTVVGPGVTVTLPGRVSTRLVTQRVLGPVRTVTKRVTARQPAPPRATVVLPRRTVMVEQPAQTVTATTTVTPPTVTVTMAPEKNTIVLTRTEQIRLSLAWILVGILLSILLLMAAYKWGYVRGDDGNRTFLRDAVRDLRQNR